MRKLLYILALVLPAAVAQAQWNCGSTGTAWTLNDGGVCSVYEGSGAVFQLRGQSGGGITSGAVNVVPTGNVHGGYGFFNNTAIDIRAFTAHFTFIPNNWNIAFVVQNVTVNPGYTGGAFTSGAGCEGGFYQGFGTRPNNLFAMSFSNSDTAGSSGNHFGSVQVFQQNQEPCNPNDGSSNYVIATRLNPSPVNLTPSGIQYTHTTDTIDATVGYDGSTVTLNMFDATTGGSCPGSSCFTQTWSNVSIPSLINSTTGYVGFSAGVGSGSPQVPTTSDLLVPAFSYAVNTVGATPGSTATSGGVSTAANPTFSPGAGTYSSPQSVTIASTTSGSYICYTLGNAGATIMPVPDNYGACGGGGTLYSGPVTVSSSQTLYATAGVSSNGASGSGYLPSGFVHGAYTISGSTPQATTPTASPAAGTYSSTQNVALSTTAGPTICWSTTGTPATNGATGCNSGTLYTSTIAVSASETLSFVAGGTGYTDSTVGSAGYTITLPTAATPTFSPGAGTYSSAQSVAISDSTSGATIYYTTNGSTPNTSSAVYSGAVTVGSTETLQAIATASGYTQSAVGSAAYTITPVAATPTFSPGAGTYTSAQSVAISDSISGATIYYTTNGSTPTTSSTVYSGAVTVSSTETLQAIATASGYTQSAVGSAVYTITPVATTPTFSPGAGTYSSTQTVAMSDSTSGATIYYTTNGSTPTTSSAVYSGAVTVSSTETLRAIATASGYTQSAVGSATYTITAVAATPTFSPGAGTYSSAQSVTLADSTPGATIYYTTNGTTPTTSSILYTGAVTVSSTETLQAIVTAPGYTQSAVGSAAYTINAVTSQGTVVITGKATVGGKVIVR